MHKDFCLELHIQLKNTVEPGYYDISLRYTSAIKSDILLRPFIRRR